MALISRVLMLISLLATPLQAATIQYVTSTGIVTGASDSTVDVVDGRSTVTIAEAVSAIQWPIPSGCANGRAEWSDITDAGAVNAAGAGMVARTDLVWFTSTSTLWSGCAQVSSAAEVNVLVEAAILAAVGESALAVAVPRLRGHTQGRCPDANMSAHCQAARAALSTLDSATLSEEELDDVLTQAVILRSDATTFIASEFP